ncbi:MAG: type 1 glutamine amidotransferase domain-containing protein [Anaeromyxobacteraceae bacterium]
MARIGFLLDSDFEDSEFRIPYDRVKAAGHEAIVIGLQQGKELHGKKGKEHVRAERAASDVTGDELDALVIPGGYSPDHLRTSLDVVRVTRHVYQAGRPVAAVCHGPWLLVEAEAIDGRTVTSWPSLRTDLVNAGARWVDREVVEDGNVITSRNPGDLEAFSAAILRHLEARSSAHQAAASTEQAPGPSFH